MAVPSLHGALIVTIFLAARLVGYSGAFVIASEVVPDLCAAGGWVLQEKCSLRGEAESPNSPCCGTMRALKELGCFCQRSTTRAEHSSEIQQIAALCNCELSTDACGPSHIDVAEVFDPLGGKDDGTGLKPDLGQVGDYQAVLDLSSTPETVTTIFQSESNGQVTMRYSEGLNTQGDSMLSFKVDIPDAEDLNIDMEYEITAEDSLATQGGFELELAEVENPSTAALGSKISEETELLKPAVPNPPRLEGDVSRAAQASDITMEALGESRTVEVTMSMPEGLLRAFNNSDVTIDMEYDPSATGGVFSTAAVTLDDGVLESSFTGQAIGSLLRSAAQYLSSELAVPLSSTMVNAASEAGVDEPDQANKDSLLGSALSFLFAVGEDIKESIPNRALHDGDVIQIQREEDDMLHWRQKGEDTRGTPEPREARRSLGKVTKAIWSGVLDRTSHKKASWLDDCSVCALVHRYAAVLWGVVIIGAAVLAYYAVNARVWGLSESAPTDPNTELQQPLIVCAADFAKSGSSQTDIVLPLWSPPKSFL